ncbi:nucleotidyltransferase domain-containing protein [uncultured Roseibium sp.]|uniref:nucleotidyltransferase domain-containing protein n=1 Tax=uncultured Roseibium sp. TaxID=1936171 RepID=UPI0026223151|nr:nucleotidyltransferase domain-containing protein [uncultured Roseibium sp.]
MSVDQHGYIGVVGDQPFQTDFHSLLQEVRDRFSPQTLTLVHSVYIYGSIATGKAVAGRSDLDLTLILNKAPSKHDSDLIESKRRNFEIANPIVSKVDFGIGFLEDIVSVDASLAWRYWLKHHCRCIAGEDLAEDIPLFRPSRSLALEVNGDFEQVLGKYHRLLLVSRPASNNGRLVREASRKLIRSTNMLRKDRDIDWPDTLEEHVARFQGLFPDHRDELQYFFQQAREPVAEPEYFAGRLEAFVGWMSGVLHNRAQ